MSQSTLDTVTGPSAAIVGWFQRIPPQSSLLPQGYAAWARRNPFMRWVRRAAMVQLFASGNVIPPAPLGGYAAFQALVATKEFRGAVALRDVSATWDDAANTVALHYLLDVQPGFTPRNSWTNVPGAGWQVQNKGYWPGGADTDVQESTTRTSATITVYARVKLCWFLNALSSFATFHFAPWAIAQLKYTLQRTGETEIEFAGSRIPSQYYYIDWTLHSQHDMRQNTRGDVHGFLTRGHCRDAPVFVVSRFPP